MSRTENWENTIRRALEALDGEADEPAVLRWVQDNRQGLRSGWQHEAHAALLAHSDGRGRALFASAPDGSSRWRLLEMEALPAVILPANPERAEWPRLSRLMARGLGEAGGGGLTGLELYLLGLVAYRLGWHAEASALVGQALAAGLADGYRPEAERLRAICALKMES